MQTKEMANILNRNQKMRMVRLTCSWKRIIILKCFYYDRQFVLSSRLRSFQSSSELLRDGKEITT